MDTVATRKAILAAGSVVALAFAYRYGWFASIRGQVPTNDKATTQEGHGNNKDPGAKVVADSAVSVMYRINADMTDECDRIYAGQMLKIIDVVAGVVSRRHAEMGCVTISLDRFILIQEIRTGDIIHLNASVNRAWGSSLETGVKVTRVDPTTGREQYCCHAYLTFVAIAPSPNDQEGPSLSLRLGGRDSEAHTRPRPKLKRLIPLTLIEKRRFLLAGRRRDVRMAQPPQGPQFNEFRAEVLAMSNHSDSRAQDSDYLRAQSREIDSLEKELLADALASQDGDLVFKEDEQGHVHVTIDGAKHEGLDPPSAELTELDGIISNRKARRRNTWINMGAASQSSPLAPTGDDSWDIGSAQRSPVQRFGLTPLDESWVEHDDPIQQIAMKDTIVSTLHLVLPQHANSAGVLFGGQLMEWMEKTAHIAAHRLGKKDCAWVTAGMDGLEFREAVAVGHVLTFRAVITRVWTSSMEVYVCSHADATPSSPRFTNECFLSLVALSRRDKQPTRLKIEITPDAGTTSERIWETADTRKAQRLEMRDMLYRISTTYDQCIRKKLIAVMNEAAIRATYYPPEGLRWLLGL